jgi:hypothetical protein
LTTNRYSIGRACLDLGLFGPKVKRALGIRRSITGKNPFFDRQASERGEVVWKWIDDLDGREFLQSKKRQESSVDPF